MLAVNVLKDIFKNSLVGIDWEKTEIYTRDSWEVIATLTLFL